MLSVRYRSEFMRMCIHMYFGFYSQTVLSLILLKWFNLFCPARIWDFIQFSPLLRHNPNKCSTYLISFAFDLVRCYFFFHHSLFICALYIPTFRLKTKDQPTHRHTRKKPFYLILSAIHEYVLFCLLSYFSLMATFFCVCILWTIWIVCLFFSRFTHVVYVNNVFSLEYKKLYSGSFWRPAQIQIKLIANCWHFFIVHFSLYVLLAYLTQRMVTFDDENGVYSIFGQCKYNHSEIYSRWASQLPAQLVCLLFYFFLLGMY